MDIYISMVRKYIVAHSPTDPLRMNNGQAFEYNKPTVGLGVIKNDNHNVSDTHNNKPVQLIVKICQAVITIDQTNNVVKNFTFQKITHHELKPDWLMFHCLFISLYSRHT